MSIEEKRHLGQSLGKLPPDNLSRVIQIVSQRNPSFNIHSDEIEVDIDAQVFQTFLPLHSPLQVVKASSTNLSGTSMPSMHLLVV